MLVQVVVEGHVGVQCGIRPALKDHLDGFVQGVHAGAGGAVLLRQLHVGAADGVGGGLPLQVLKGSDGVVVGFHHQRGADVGVGGAEIIGLLPAVGDVHAVDDHVIPSGLHTGQQTVPLSFHEGGLHPQLFGNGLAHLYIVAHQGIGIVVEGPGGPVALQGNDQLALALDLGQPVGGGLFLLAAAGKDTQAQGQGQDNRHILFHWISSCSVSPSMVLRKALDRSWDGF